MILFISVLHNTDFEMASSFHVHMCTHTICVCLHKQHNCLDYVVQVYRSFYLLWLGVRRWLHRCHLRRQNRLNQEKTSEANDSPSSASGSVVLTQNSAVGSRSPALESPMGLPESFPWPLQDGNVSDDSGVMMQEPVQHRLQGRKMNHGRCRREEALEPPQKRQRLRAFAIQFPRLQSVHVGDGVVTMRRIPKVSQVVYNC